MAHCLGEYAAPSVLSVLKLGVFTSIFCYLLLSEPILFHFKMRQQANFLELQIINFIEANLLLLFFVNKCQRQHCLLLSMIIYRVSRSIRFFKKDNKSADQPDLRNNAQPVIT